jgi:hypothetical protein
MWDGESPERSNIPNLQMEGLPPSPRLLFDELVRGWSGLAPTGKRMMRVPTNPRGAKAD